MSYTPNHGSCARGVFFVQLMCLVALTGAFTLGQTASAQAQEAPPKEQPKPDQPAPEEEAKEATPAAKSKVLLLSVESAKGQVSSLVTERIDTKLRESVGQQDTLILMPSFEQIREELAGEGQSSALISKAEQLYASGIGLLTAGQNEKARENFGRAVDLMTKNLADVQRYDVFADALVNLALANHLTGYDLDGRKRMQQYAHLRPGKTLNPEKYPKELIEVYTKEVGKVKKAGPGKLKITSTKPKAAVFIDGSFKGATPMTVEDVGFGEHYLVVRHGDGDVWAGQVRVRGRGKEQEFKAEFTQDAVAGGATEKGGMPTYYKDLKTTLAKGVFSTSDIAAFLQELSSQSGAPHISWVILVKSGMGYKAVPFVWLSQTQVLLQGDASKFNFELSNLAVSVSELSGTIAMLLKDRPPANAVSDVSLIEAPSVAVVVTKPGAPTSPVIKPKGPVTPAVKTKTPFEVPPEEDEDDDTMFYLGAGAAGVVLIAGIVVGSILLFSDDENEGTQPSSGFSAEVTW